MPLLEKKTYENTCTAASTRLCLLFYTGLFWRATFFTTNFYGYCSFMFIKLWLFTLDKNYRDFYGHKTLNITKFCKSISEHQGWKLKFLKTLLFIKKIITMLWELASSIFGHLKNENARKFSVQINTINISFDKTFMQACKLSKMFAIY